MIKQVDLGVHKITIAVAITEPELGKVRYLWAMKQRFLTTKQKMN